MKSSYDCVVMGGGPAGSTAAALLADQGLSTLLVEREKFPRFHVGESLMPETYWIFERLGVLDTMQKSDFTKKVSVQFVGGSGRDSAPFYFREHDKRDCARTWQVSRAKFDNMLFENAADKGADCYDQTRVREVLFDGDQAIGVRLQTEDKELQEVSARVLVDATGQQTMIANRLQLKVEDPKFRKAAIWGYYKGAKRDEGDNAGATIILHTREKKSWFWFIPLADGITSIGVVGDNDYLLKGRGKPADVYEDELANCPGLVRRLMDAEMVGEFHVAKEFSYSTTQHSGPGWVLTGDAYGFIDPIYSSGVFFAMKTAEMAADAIIEGFEKNDLSGQQLGKWCSEFNDGSHLVRKLVSAYYTDDFSFGSFLKEHPKHVGNLTDLLIGRVFYDGAGDIFDDMDSALQSPPQSMAE